ncbi:MULTISPECIES: NAD(P)-dependent oxidoreductase [Clostridium]|uniref:Glutamate synthase [NADPH] small chain n=3 Tax=Clostridium TaxID=1485 RepID=D8GLB8_CLOLD|nr:MULTISPECIES: NAD(P)-dependent oxidoreductase [Clostridium]ADK15477.1 NADPH-dependent glutamate synthase beta chain [Clostridium ljungdahlii DSM 13528]AGY74706.1 NAD(P)-dependent oxidoreductase [Clostridium autoethanogenum DSM 10061]ALU34887.1 Pyridine nucleotide-disulfide oxidoreductase class-II [Clostridium autoethanogenum DSM 10061]OAA85523.1 Glutamate synthase [NADPH] small chain [Clostridium ljungdahlii DSM 13528]OVY51723.1 Glutamate synthase [NADPH] small chain [Clostridium autoethano
MDKIVFGEANRCLGCKVPQCKKGCPVSTPINEVIKLFKENKIKEAGKLLFENNPMSAICSQVCPHEKFCEGHCVLGKKGTPIKFGLIEKYISDFYLNFITSADIKKLNKKIAVVGSGPAGLSIAFIMARKGYDVTIFESHEDIGGVLRYGIPAFRLPKDILDRLKDKLLHMRVKIRPNTLIGPVITVEDLFRDGYRAVYIGTGVWSPRSLGLKGETYGNVNYAIDYLKNPEAYNLGDKVAIIGAGNVAMDAARTIIRNGSNDVTIIARSDEEHAGADNIEIDYAKLDGVKFLYKMAPVEITDDGIKVVPTEVSFDENTGKKKVTLKDEETKLFNADSIIIAVGQGPKANIVNNSEGIEVNSKGLIQTDDSGRTTRSGVFASGDVVTGAKTVVEAVEVSKHLVNAMEEYIKSMDKKFESSDKN